MTISLTLKPWEYRKLAEVHVAGGQDGLKRRLLAKLNPDGSETGAWRIDLTDEGMGEIIRHMGYGGGQGGWQSCLRATFIRAMLKYCGAQQ